MKISAITLQARNPNRVNISVDGAYRFSLDVFQVVELGLIVNKDYDEEQLVRFEQESQFGKLYAQTLAYTLLRPHSEQEVRDYLWRKTQQTKYKTRSGEVKERAAISQENATKVLERLREKHYIDDERFARFWVENRHQKKGASVRKLQAELRAKGIASEIIKKIMQNSPRDEKGELLKMIEKKRSRYSDTQKLMVYLVRQGFSYELVKEVLKEINDD